VLTCFGKYDGHEVTRVVGTARAQQILTRPTDSFVFISSETKKPRHRGEDDGDDEAEA
jgi:hypothetical protein